MMMMMMMMLMMMVMAMMMMMMMAVIVMMTMIIIIVSIIIVIIISVMTSLFRVICLYDPRYPTSLMTAIFASMFIPCDFVVPHLRRFRSSTHLRCGFTCKIFGPE